MTTTTTTSFVYLIRDGDRHKIGKSDNPHFRLTEVASRAAVIVHLIPSVNPFQVENALHRRFAALRADGPGREWFNLDASDVALICTLARVDSADDLPADLSPAPVEFQDRHKNPVASFRPKPPMRAVLQQLADDERRSVAQIIEILLEEAMTARGLWPPSAD